MPDFLNKNPNSIFPVRSTMSYSLESGLHTLTSRLVNSTMNQIPNLHQIHAIEKKGTEFSSRKSYLISGWRVFNCHYCQSYLAAKRCRNLLTCWQNIITCYLSESNGSRSAPFCDYPQYIVSHSTQSLLSPNFGLKRMHSLVKNVLLEDYVVVLKTYWVQFLGVKQ